MRTLTVHINPSYIQILEEGFSENVSFIKFSYFGYCETVRCGGKLVSEEMRADEQFDLQGYLKSFVCDIIEYSFELMIKREYRILDDLNLVHT